MPDVFSERHAVNLPLVSEDRDLRVRPNVPANVASPGQRIEIHESVPRASMTTIGNAGEAKSFVVGNGEPLTSALHSTSRRIV